MSTDTHFSVIITGMSLIFTVMVVIFGLIIRAIVRFTRVEERLTEVMKDAREDRKATNERLTYLERNVWPVATRTQRREERA